MRKKYFFCAFLLFVQVYLAMAQLKVVFKIHAPASNSATVDSLYLEGNFKQWKAAERDGNYSASPGVL